MDRNLTRRALALMDAHEAFVRATVVKTVGSVPGKLGATMLITRTGESFGTVGGAALEENIRRLALATFVHRRGDLYHFDLQAWSAGGLPSLCGGTVEIALEFVPARPNLLLWGGGHVAHALSALLPTLEYDFSVADDREEWILPERFPQAERRERVEPSRLWEVFEPGRFTHLYVLGYDAGKDTEVLARSLERFPNTIGFIASETKRLHVYAELRRRGCAEEAIRRVRSPIGLPVRAETPAEIAVSIVAEIVAGMHPVDPATSPAPLEEGPRAEPRAP